MKIQEYMRQIESDLRNFQKFVAKRTDEYPEDMTLDEWDELWHDWDRNRTEYVNKCPACDGLRQVQVFDSNYKLIGVKSCPTCSNKTKQTI